MQQIIPWAELQALANHTIRRERTAGLRFVGLSIMLRVYFLQQWFNLSDPGAEDALYESPVLRHFVGIDSGACAGAGREHHPRVPSPAGEARTGRGDA